MGSHLATQGYITQKLHGVLFFPATWKYPQSMKPKQPTADFKRFNMASGAGIDL